MEDLLLTIEKNKFYQDLIKSIPEDNRAEFVNEVTKLASLMTNVCHSLDELLQTEEGPDKFLEAVGSAINRRAFKDNNGVTEIPWPEKN